MLDGVPNVRWTVAGVPGKLTASSSLSPAAKRLCTSSLSLVDGVLDLREASSGAGLLSRPVIESSSSDTDLLTAAAKVDSSSGGLPENDKTVLFAEPGLLFLVSAA